MATRKFYMVIAAVFSAMLVPAASAITVNVSDGGEVSIGSNDVLTDFGMVTGDVRFNLGNFSWIPSEIWFLPEDVDPGVFSKGLTQDSVIEIPENVTSSTCRTAVYYNNETGYGFKVYNTGTTTQIFPNGTFCGLAYNGTYFVVAKY
jgi:hypothetical protein